MGLLRRFALTLIAVSRVPPGAYRIPDPESRSRRRALAQGVMDRSHVVRDLGACLTLSLDGFGLINHGFLASRSCYQAIVETLLR
jgi:hypothetical protein